jgi:penicillin-binding protein 1A
MWIAYMRTALKDVPEKPFEMPPGVSTARIDPGTGELAASGDPHSMLEVFKTEDIARLAAGPNSASDQEKKVQQDAYGIF